MPTVLWATPVPPDRSGGGGHIRQAHLLAALCEQATVHLVSSGPVRDPAVRSAVACLEEVGVAEEGLGDRPRWARRTRDLRLAVGGLPREVAAFSQVRKAVAGTVSSTTADVVLVEYAGLAPLVGGRRPGQRWLLTMHNVLSVMAAQEAAVAPARRQRWLHSRDARNARRWERLTAARYDQVIAVSADDALALGGEAAVVPNGVDVERLRPTPLPPEPTVVFTGALYTGPNRDGLLWFCREVWPIVLRQNPSAAFVVAGSRPGAEIIALGLLPGVSVHPDVPDTAPHLAAARVAVVPLRIGSGTRLKALEAMACGRPVVGTAAGLGGLCLEDGRHAVFADDPAAFAAAVCRALDDRQWAESLGRAGRRLVEQRYDWRLIGQGFVDVVLSGTQR